MDVVPVGLTRRVPLAQGLSAANGRTTDEVEPVKEAVPPNTGSVQLIAPGDKTEPQYSCTAATSVPEPRTAESETVTEPT